MMHDSLYHYRARVVGVYDADTITVDIDLGLGIWARGEKLRLYGIDAPEMRGPEKDDGTVSRDWVRERILNKDVLIRTVKDGKGKYGRYLAEVFTEDGMNINQELVRLELAEEREY